MTTVSENALSNLPCPQSRQSTTLEIPSASKGKPVVIGLYGVPGSGKTFLLNQLMCHLRQDEFECYEGSWMIDSVVPGGLKTFENMEEQEKIQWRQLALKKIAKECADSGRTGVVTGHFMFSRKREEEGLPVYTQSDLNIYTHILYLDIPAELVVKRRQNDTGRSRPTISVAHCRKWQEEEKTQLRLLCRAYRILFSLVSEVERISLDRILTHLRDFRDHNKEYNLSQAQTCLDEALIASKDQLETMLVMDADKTLAAEDSGAIFWDIISGFRRWENKDCPLNALFSSPLGYSYTAFRQATLLYEEAANDQDFEIVCQEVASEVKMYPEFVSLLHRIVDKKHVRAVVVTCGLRRVWEIVLKEKGLSKIVKVIGGGRIADGYVVTAEVKAAVVSRLQDTYKTYVWAFGDSQLDIDMLRKADQAIVVVGAEKTRSTTMDAVLIEAISDGLQARQAVLPRNTLPRLDTTTLPLIQLTEPEFISAVLCHRRRLTGTQVLHATNRKAAKLLMTPMRDATIAGPALRKAHHCVGWYLAAEFLSDVIGIEEYPIRHVQGHHTTGYRLLYEPQTSIVALMRGGEAMALGVNDAIPRAMFVHASRPEDIMLHHLLGQFTLVLVDSVVNSGETVVQFVEHVHKLHPTIRIVILAGVVQAQAVSKGSLAEALARYPNLDLVALRLSDNKFTGSGTTDTGNRLFNTTHLA